MPDTTRRWPDLLDAVLSRRPISAAVRNLASVWLRHGAFHHHKWPAVWLALTANLDLSVEERTLAHDYLGSFEPDMFSLPRVVTAWTEVWTRLVREAGPTESLIAAARSTAPLAGHHGTFVRRVILRIYRYGWDKEERGWADDWLMKWLRDDAGRPAAWPNVYLSMLESKEDDRSFLELGHTWLRNGNPNVTKWPKVWHLLSPFIERSEHLNIGVDWLVRADIKMQSWADVLVEEIEANPGALTRVVPKAKAWLMAGNYHQSRHIIERFVDEQVGQESSAELSSTNIDKPDDITEISVKDFLDRRLGIDLRISSFTYRWITDLIRKLGFSSIAQLAIATQDYDDTRISRVLTSGRQGQTSRFELVLLAALRETFISRHPWARYTWFKELQLGYLAKLDEADIHGLDPRTLRSIKLPIDE